jgi:ferrous-iron efflux pump FieF
MVTINTSALSDYKERERSVLVSFIIDFILILPDIVAAILANSIILFADVLKCGNELIATFLAWLTIRRVSKGKDVVYNYGYGKLENLTSMVVAFVMAISIIVVLYTAIERLKNPETMHANGVGLGIFLMSVGVCINSWLWVKNYRIARKKYSPVMDSQWRLFRAKAFADGSVLLALVMSLVLSRYHWSVYVDPAASFVIIGFLMFSAYGVISNSVYDLMDKTLEESLQLIIVRELVAYFDQYKSLHGVRSRRAGSDIFIEIYLEFEGEKTMAEVQEVINCLKATLEKKIKDSHVAISPAISPMV